MPSDDILLEAEDKMDKAVQHLGEVFRGIRTGRASPGLVDNITVDYYGSPTPLKHMAAVSIPERPEEMAPGALKLEIDWVDAAVAIPSR